MTITLTDLKQRLLERVDPNEVVELLEISTEELVNVFSDKIEERYDILVSDLYDEIEEEDE